MSRKETVQSGTEESFESRMDRLNVWTNLDNIYGDYRTVFTLAEEYKEGLIGAAIETSADDTYVIRDVVNYSEVKPKTKKETIMMALEATRLDHHNAGRPHVVLIHPSAKVRVTDFGRLFFQYQTRYRQILEEINAEGKHHIEIPPKRDPFAR